MNLRQTDINRREVFKPPCNLYKIRPSVSFRVSNKVKISEKYISLLSSFRNKHSPTVTDYPILQIRGNNLNKCHPIFAWSSVKI